METFVSVATDTILITLVLALAAFGLAIIYGLIGVINMGHGAMLTLGAYFTWWLTRYGMPFIPSVLLAAVAVGAVGLALEHLIIRHLAVDLGVLPRRHRDDQDRIRNGLSERRSADRWSDRPRFLPDTGLSDPDRRP